jgi:glycosyltransferase involved in cell wall biosynthesis
VRVIKIIEEGRIGGPQIDILRVTPHVQRGGIETIVVLPNKNSTEFQSRLAENEIPFYVLSLTTLQKHPLRLLVYALKFIPELFFLTRLIINLKPDLIHVGGGSWQIKGVLAGRLAGRKVLWHLNDTKTPTVLKIIFNIIQPLSGAFMVAGHRVQGYYLAHEKERHIFNISAPVDCQLYNPDILPPTNNNGTQRIITVANISPVKGLERFLNVAAKLNKKTNVSLEFRIIGLVHDSQMKYFEFLNRIKVKLALDNLHFVKGVDDVRKELAQADIYVCTSLAEASPISVWEAMSMGKPIVSTDVGEVSAIVINGETGFVVPVMETEEMLNKILYYIKNRNEAKVMGNKARQTALEKLDTCKIAEKQIIAYQTTIKGK